MNETQDLFIKNMREFTAVEFDFVDDYPVVAPRSGKSAQLVVGVAWAAFKAGIREGKKHRVNNGYLRSTDIKIEGELLDEYK